MVLAGAIITKTFVASPRVKNTEKWKKMRNDGKI